MNWKQGVRVMSKIVGITGRAGSGKNSVANFLVGYKTIEFSDKVKEIAIQCFGWDGVKDEQGRKLLQDIGTAGRTYDASIWIRDVQSRMYPGYWAIPGLRYLNEAEWIRSKGGVIIRTIGRKSDLGNLSEHSSETEMDLIRADYIINNTGTLIDLKIKVEELQEEIG